MAQITEGTPLLGALDAGAAGVVEGLLDSLVAIEVRGGHGSGVIWSPDGLIVTNNHVAHGDEARVVLRDGTRLVGTVTAREPRRDLAALRVDRRDLPAAPQGDSARVRVGELVYAAGNPLGLRGVVTAGIVTAVGQSADGVGASGRGRGRLDRLIQADVSLAPGNSGGPLADAAGRVIGINAMIGPNGVALAIPSATVAAFLAGEGAESADGPRLGVVVSEALLAGPGGERGALVLVAVEPGSPAARAGLLQGDVLLALDGRATATGEDLHRGLAAWRAGAGARLTLLRGGFPREVVLPPPLAAAA
jgi:S1-C subfamily serine protease